MNDSVKIIENGFVFTGDKQNRAGHLSLLIQSGRIIDIGKPAQVLKAMYPAAEVINAAGKILMPGFVDAHYSGESFILRYLTSGHTMARWNRSPLIRRAFEYLQKGASYEEYQKLYRLSYFAALKSGITTLAEYGIDNPEFSFTAAHEAMIQANLKGYIGLHNGDQMEAARKLRDTPIRFALVIAGEEDLTLYNLQMIIRSAREHGYPIILHLGQTRRAFDIIKRNFKKSIIQFYAEYHVFDSPCHLIRLACFEEGDIEFISKSNMPLVLSPTAIVLKGVEVPPLEELLKNKIMLALSSEWGAADPLKNIQAYCYMLKMQGLSIDKGNELLALHTKNAAQALGLDKEIGSMEVGKKADIVFLDMSDFQMQTIFAFGNAEKMLEFILQEATSKEVSDVMINGEFYIREGHILTYAEEDLAKEGQELLTKLIQIGGGQSMGPQSSAAILTLPTQNTTEPRIQEKELPFEEGFRILHKETSLPTYSEGEDNISQKKPSELPKDVRKSFGDDENEF